MKPATHGLIRSAATVGVYTLGSRLLGFARDILIARYLGAGPVGDAFFVAFKLPNLFRRLFAEGAFNLAFVPLFAGLLKGDGRDAARRFAEDALALLLWVLLGATVLAEIAMPWLMLVFAPGFVADPAKFDLAVALSRITFPYLMMISLVSLLGGILNSLGRFAAAAAAPMLLNVAMIAALLSLGRRLETPGHALSWGVAAAGVVQFLFLAWNCHRQGMLPALPKPRLTPLVRRLTTVMAPAAIGSGVAQLNLMVDMIIASLLPTGAVSFLYYADRVVQLPLGVIGVALGTALLPLLASQIRGRDDAGASASQNRALEFGLLITLPAAAGLMTAAVPITHVLFERGAFDATATAATARAMAAFAFGLPAYVLIKVLAPGYYARQDTRTPLKIAAVCLAANVALTLILIWPLAHAGIALASALASWLNTALLARGLIGRGQLVLDSRLRQRVPRMAAAAAAMAALLWLAMALIDPWLGAPGLASKASALALLLGVGVGGFVAAALAAGAARPSELRAVLKK